MKEFNKKLYIIASLIENDSNNVQSVSLANKIRMKVRNSPTSTYKSLSTIMPTYFQMINDRTLTVQHILGIFELEPSYNDAIGALFNRSDMFYSVLDDMLRILEFE